MPPGAVWGLKLVGPPELYLGILSKQSGITQLGGIARVTARNRTDLEFKGQRWGDAKAYC